MRWMRRVFVGKLDRTDEFLLLTPTGATKTRCVRRLEGDNAWNLQFLNLCVGSPWKATARSRHQQSNKRMSWKAADVRKECRARIEQEMVNKGDAIKLETSGNQEEEIVPEPDVGLKKRKLGEPDINPGGASSLTADTPKRRESEQGSSANESSLAFCIAAVNNLVCDTPTVDLSRDRTALSGKFPEDELKAGRELELRNMLNFDAFDLVEELPPGKHAYDMVWVDEWRGDRVRSRLSRTTCLWELQTRFSSSICWHELQGLRNPCH